MDLTDVEKKLKKGNRILFDGKSPCLQELLELMQGQSHKTLVLWAFACVAHTLVWFEQLCPGESRPREGFLLCQKWAAGQIKMPQAKSGILACHSVAKELSDPVAVALCHGIGQGISTVHVGTHAPGLIFYELTAIVRGKGWDNCPGPLQEKIAYYKEQLCYLQENGHKECRPWAAFMEKN